MRARLPAVARPEEEEVLEPAPVREADSVLEEEESAMSRAVEPA